MNLRFYLDYIRRCRRDLRNLSSKTGINTTYLWWDFLKCSIAHGAILNHYTRGNLHQLKGCERRKSLTYRRILSVYRTCNSPSSIPILNEKHLFNAHFAPFIKREWLYSGEMTEKEFITLCDHNRQLIVKPADGVEGMGIRKVEVPEDETERLVLFSELKRERCMVEEVISQHPDMVYGNTSVNTIRAHSIMDREGNVHILKMLLRVGVRDSVVDNYAHGGCVYELSTDSGHIISPSLMKTGKEVYVHPGTDIFVLGRKVPNWEKVTEGVKAAHKHLPQCRFIGWDVAVTPEGIELIEGNHNPDYELFEFFGSKGWYEKIKPYL